MLHYVGEGQSGDQQFTQGNKAILNHRRDGRTLEGFLVDRSGATYLGEFEFAGYYRVDAPDLIHVHLLRQVIVFQLEPIGELPIELPKAPHVPATRPVLEEFRFTPSASRPARRSSRQEKTELAGSYMRHLERTGHEARLLRIVPPGEAQPFSPTIWDQTADELIDIRAQVTREQVRNAIGLLLDSARFVNATSLALLVPTLPRPDLLTFLHHVGVVAIYRDDTGWVRAEPRTATEQGHHSPATSVAVRARSVAP